MISRRDLPSGFPLLKYSSWAPGAATTSKVGLGMYSLILPLTAIFVRPLTWTYWMRPSYSGGRNLVKASGVSYMWLSASKTGKSSVRVGMASLLCCPLREPLPPSGTAPARQRPGSFPRTLTAPVAERKCHLRYHPPVRVSVGVSGAVTGRGGMRG